MHGCSFEADVAVFSDVAHGSQYVIRGQSSKNYNDRPTKCMHFSSQLIYTYHIHLRLKVIESLKT